MNGFAIRTAILSSLFANLVASAAFAAEPAIAIVLTGLHAPRGVAVRPGGNGGRYEIFVSDTAAGRIVRLWSDEPGKSTDVITGFATRTDRSENAGPFGLTFLDRDHLVVACGSDPVVRMYELSADAATQPADKPTQEVHSADVESIYCLARSRANDNVPDMLVATCGTRAWKRGLGKIVVRAGTLDNLTPFTANESAAELDPPLGVAVSERGFVAVAQADPTTDPPQSQIAFFNPRDGSPIMAVPVMLADIFGLAYHPQTGNLYAIDFFIRDQKAGGVFRIDDASEPGKTGCRAVRIATIERPTSLAFGPDGALFVTNTEKSNGTEAGRGTLFRITGEL